MQKKKMWKIKELFNKLEKLKLKNI
jgi:hypothetical protein